MKNQRNIFETKETRPKSQNNYVMEIRNLPNKEFKVMIINILNKFGR